MIIRVTETEFETSDGRVVPHPVPFEPGQVPTIEEFQRWYDQWYEMFNSQGFLADDTAGRSDGKT